MTNAYSIPQFSLKHLLVAFAGVSGVLGLGMTVGYGAASALAFGLGIWLTWAGLRTKRELPALGVPLIVGGGMGMFLAMISWLVFGIGPIYLPDHYPKDVRRMIALAEADPWKTKVYRHDNGTGFFLEHVSQMAISQWQVDKIVSAFNMEEVEASAIDPWFWQQFPRRWQPRQTSESKFYKGTLDMADYNAMYDPPSACFYVWCVEDYN